MYVILGNHFSFRKRYAVFKDDGNKTGCPEIYSFHSLESMLLAFLLSRRSPENSILSFKNNYNYN